MPCQGDDARSHSHESRSYPKWTPDEVLITGGSGELRWDVGADWVRLSGSGLALESRAYPCGARRGARVLEAYRPSTLEGSRGPPAAQNRVHG